MNAVIVIPVFNEAATLEPLTEQIFQHMPFESFRIFFVDDGSTDDSRAVMHALSERYPNVGYLAFARNAGKTQALASAFRRIDADMVITMDADLQDDPSELPKLIEAIEDGADLVCGWKQNRRDPVRKTFPSRVFNAAMSGMFGLSLHDINTGFKAMRGELAKALPLTEDRHRFIPVLAAKLGYRVTEVPVLHHPRRHGESKYGFERYFEGIRDALQLWTESPQTLRSAGPPPEPEGLVAEVVLAE